MGTDLQSILAQDGQLDAFGYDYNSQTTGASYGWNWNGSAWVNPNRSVGYTLDLAGNRNQVGDNVNGNASYQHNNLNQYTAVGVDAVGYDAWHSINLYQGVNYAYINDGRLTHAWASGSDYWMKYDALGRTVGRYLNGRGWTYFFYDGEKPISEVGATGATNIYGLGIDEPVIRFEPANVFYFYQDHEGSVTHVFDMNGGVAERYRYDAFGKPKIMDAAGNVRTVSAINNRFLFTGREWAPNNLGFYEYRARAYHPGLGRFTSEDPKGFDAGDYNLYRYCGNDPEDRTDPMGLFAWGGMGEWATRATIGWLDSGQGAHGDGETAIGGAIGGISVTQTNAPSEHNSQPAAASVEIKAEIRGRLEHGMKLQHNVSIDRLGHILQNNAKAGYTGVPAPGGTARIPGFAVGYAKTTLSNGIVHLQLKGAAVSPALVGIGQAYLFPIHYSVNFNFNFASGKMSFQGNHSSFPSFHIEAGRVTYDRPERRELDIGGLFWGRETSVASSGEL